MTAASFGSQVGQQREPFGRPGQRQHLVAAPAVPFGDRVLGPVHVVDARVARQIRQPRAQPLHQPVRRLSVPDVDREVQHAGRHGLITVVARRSKRASVQTRHQ